jgi:hypothetical protein
MEPEGPLPWPSRPMEGPRSPAVRVFVQHRRLMFARGPDDYEPGADPVGHPLERPRGPLGSCGEAVGSGRERGHTPAPDDPPAREPPPNRPKNG